MSQQYKVIRWHTSANASVPATCPCLMWLASNKWPFQLLFPSAKVSDKENPDRTILHWSSAIFYRIDDCSELYEFLPWVLQMSLPLWVGKRSQFQVTTRGRPMHWWYGVNDCGQMLEAPTSNNSSLQLPSIDFLSQSNAKAKRCHGKDTYSFPSNCFTPSKQIIVIQSQRSIHFSQR